jgi:hypothetical protein
LVHQREDISHHVAYIFEVNPVKWKNVKKSQSAIHTRLLTY